MQCPLVLYGIELTTIVSNRMQKHLPTVRELAPKGQTAIGGHCTNLKNYA